MIVPEMDRYIETYRGIVQLSQCDTMGHMNTQFYVAIFDQTLLQLVARMGFSTAKEDYRGFGWADVKHVIDYRQELLAGPKQNHKPHTQSGAASVEERGRISSPGASGKHLLSLQTTARRKVKSA